MTKTSIVTSVDVSVYPDPDYYYTVSVADDQMALQYFQRGAASGDTKPFAEITFASLEEMEAVVAAMQKAIKFHKE